ncbi:MAG: radical SAM protein [Clostridia bacterium]|nr:radical SAM protein [Clostridia bacterium]
MTVTYEVDTGLYINLTNRCTNRCEFCIRNNDDGAYGSDTLWLEREPTAEQVIESVFSRDLSRYSEIVFCGYGEPTCRLDVLLEVARAVKERDKNIKIRLNTNGHSNLINGAPTEHLFAGLVDVMSISLNTPNAERYVDMCHPVYKEKAFSALLDFTRNVKNYVQKTTLSVVRQYLTEQELAECERIAAELGVTLKVRDYISA